MKLTYEQEAIIKRAGKSVEDFERDLKDNPSHLNLNVLNDIGESLLVTFQNDNQLGDLIMGLLTQIQDLQQRVEALENA